MNNEKKKKNKLTEVTTYPVTFSLESNKKNIISETNTSSNLSKKDIINQAIKLHLQGNIKKAVESYQYCINQGFNNPTVFTNYGIILRSLGNL